MTEQQNTIYSTDLYPKVDLGKISEKKQENLHGMLRIIPTIFAYNYDENKKASHPEITANLCDNEVEVDEQLKEILERLNSDYATTRMSCQYNYFGYSNIVFDYSHFYFLMKKIRNQHLKKYGNLEEYHEDSLWCAIAMNNGDKYYWTSICKFTCGIDECCGYKDKPFDCCISVNMLLFPQDVKVFVELWDKLFREKETEISKQLLSKRNKNQKQTMSSTKLTVQEEEKCRDEIREKLRIIREDQKLLDQYKRLGFSQSEDIDHVHDCKDRKKGDECKTCGFMFKKPKNELVFCEGDPNEKYMVLYSKDGFINKSEVTLGELDKAMVELHDQIDKAVKNINHKFEGKLTFDLTHPELNITINQTKIN